MTKGTAVAVRAPKVEYGGTIYTYEAAEDRYVYRMEHAYAILPKHVANVDRNAKLVGVEHAYKPAVVTRDGDTYRWDRAVGRYVNNANGHFLPLFTVWAILIGDLPPHDGTVQPVPSGLSDDNGNYAAERTEVVITVEPANTPAVSFEAIDLGDGQPEAATTQGGDPVESPAALAGMDYADNPTYAPVADNSAVVGSAEVTAGASSLAVEAGNDALVGADCGCAIGATD